MVVTGEIYDRVCEFYQEITADSNARYKSWEHCYGYFQQHKACVKDEKVLDLMSLHLAFYLASWGMLRGSSFLLKKDYRVHIEPIKILMSDKYKILHNITARELKKSETIALLLECRDEVSKEYACQKNCSPPSGTLITKIFLGVYGCVPAYDRYFKSGAKHSGIVASFNEKSIKGICDFYINNEAEFESAKKKIDNNLYTDMKLIDMYFWQLGKEVVDDNKRNDK